MLKRVGSGPKFALVVVALLALFYGLDWTCTQVVGFSKAYPPLKPGSVSLIGIKLEGERIVVSNGIAQLELSEEGSFGAPKAGPIGAQSGAKIPMKGLVGALRSEEAGVSELVAALAGIDLHEFPPAGTVWDAKDIETALEGDSEKRVRLEFALNTRMDGSPTDRIIKSFMRSGIHVRVRVPVRVPPKVMTGTVILPYRTRLANGVIQHPLIRDKYDASKETWEGVYEQVWQKMKRSNATEDVAGSLRALISQQNIHRLAKPVERLLARVTVLLTEHQVTDAELTKTQSRGGEGYLYTVDLRLTEEGKHRLWQYTHMNPGCQLLFVVNGVAIAAPTVQHEMKYSMVSITNVADEEDAMRAVDFIRRRAEKG